MNDEYGLAMLTGDSDTGKPTYISQVMVPSPF